MIELSEMVDLRGEIASRQAWRIGIDGFGGAGKTTLAAQIASDFEKIGGAALVCMDDFVLESRLNDLGWDHGAFDRERLRHEVLIPAQRKEPLRYYSSRSAKEIEVVNYDYLLLEGITACHPDIMEYLDLSVWVAASIQKSIQRRVQRPMSLRARAHLSRWCANDNAYALCYPPAERVDVIFDADGPKTPLIKQHVRDEYGRPLWWKTVLDGLPRLA